LFFDPLSDEKKVKKILIFRVFVCPSCADENRERIKTLKKENNQRRKNIQDENEIERERQVNMNIILKFNEPAD
jgi:predicted metal-binding protein